MTTRFTCRKTRLAAKSGTLEQNEQDLPFDPRCAMMVRMINLQQYFGAEHQSRRELSGNQHEIKVLGTR